MGRARALALIVALGACTKQPPVVLGARMPAGCTKDDTAKSERCVGWLMDRLLMTLAFSPNQDEQINAYIAAVGNRLVEASGDRRSWTFRVIDDPDVQAFAGIHTTVYINRGALEVLRDESELAGVLGHEIGHVLGGHAHEAFEELSQDLATSTRSHSEQVRSARDDEIQADETAVLLAARAGYDPQGVERMLRAYAATAPSDGLDADDQHPPWVERIARVQALAAAYPPGDRRAAEFRRAIAPLVVGRDPRTSSLVGDVAVFAIVNVALELGDHGATLADDGTIGIELDIHDAVDLRILHVEAAKALPTKPDADGIVSQIIVKGSIALAITAKGTRGIALARSIRASARAPSRSELATVTPRRVDLDAPRLLWLPPRT